MPKDIQIGFQIADKNANKQIDKHTNKHFLIYISREPQTNYQNKRKYDTHITYTYVLNVYRDLQTRHGSNEF